MISIQIRRFQAADAPALGAVFRSAILGATRHYNMAQRRAWSRVDAWDDAHWLKRVTGIQPWVAWDGDQAVGYADVQPSGLFDHFFVAEGASGRGVGKALMAHVLAHATTLGLGELHTEASRNSQGFFARYGFVPKTFKTIEAAGVVMDHTLMVRSATPPSPKRHKRHTQHFAPQWSFSPCAAHDFEAVLALRIAAMRPSLERLGRFDPQRARERLLAGFEPAHGQHIEVAGQRMGFVTLKPPTQSDPHLRLEHLYLHPDAHASGVGRAVLAQLCSDADAQGLGISVGVLDQSPALRFYLQAGFVCVAQSEFDWELSRPATAGG